MTIYCNDGLAQSFSFIFVGVPNFFLRTAMSFDCYVAIFKQLHYYTIQIKKRCLIMKTGMKNPAPSLSLVHG